MATGEPGYDPALSVQNPTPPVVIDGTGLTTTVPLLVKNGKNLSGIEVQVTGTAPSGLVVEDSSGVRQGAVGLAVAIGDWVANSAAGDFVITGPASAGTKKILIKNLSTGGVQILSPSGSGQSHGYLSVDESVGIQLGYSASTQIQIGGVRRLVTGPLAFSNSNSLTAVALQVASDPNTGIGQINGADTVSLVAGGAECIQARATLLQILCATINPADGTNIVLGTSNGTKIGTATTQRLGFFNATPVVQQTRGATTTNNVTSGGTDDTIANYTDLTTYATDAAAIRNNIYQLARIIRIHDVALRALGLVS